MANELKAACLDGANLCKAILSGATLTQASLIGANLIEADLRSISSKPSSVWVSWSFSCSPPP